MERRSSTPRMTRKVVETEAVTETESPKLAKKTSGTPRSVKNTVSTPKSVKKTVSTPKSVKKTSDTPKSVKKSADATPKSSRKSTKKVVETPVKDVADEVDGKAVSAVVNFSSDDESDLIQDVERLANYFKPVLDDIPEEDNEAHAMLGKYSKSSNLLGNRGVFLESQKYGFQTPKKNQMMERTAQILQNSSATKCLSPIPTRLLTPSRRNAAQAVAKVLSVKKNLVHSSGSKGTTPSKGRTSTEVTPVKGRTSSNVTPAKGSAAPMSARKAALNTPLRPLVLTGDEPQTPMSTRHAVKRKIEKIRCDEEEEDSSDEESSSEEDEDDDEENVDVSNLAKAQEVKRVKVTPLKKETPLKTSLRGRKKIVVQENPEEYFSTHSDGKIVTSDKTLNQLKTPRLSQEALRHMLSGEKLKFQPEIDELFVDYRDRFPKWMLLLKENFNILFYGLGSKRSLIHEFHLSKVSEENCIVVNGFFPSLTLKQILNSITSDLLETEATFSTPSEQVDFICKNIEDCLFLIIHNIDGGMLRGDKTQSLLARLASHPKIHLICSVDHINAALMWDQQKLSHYNFVMFDATTFLPYTEETLNENSLMVKQSGNLALNSLTRVFASLTPNAKGIYIIIVKYQMESVTESGAQFYSGISFKDLYRKCRKAFLVNADLTLRAQLTEFRDHKLIRSRKGADGIEYLIIPLDNSTLQEFLEQQNAA